MRRTIGDAAPRAFDPTTKLLHWLTLLLITAIFLLAFSFDLASSRQQEMVLVQLHRSLGVTLWVVWLAAGHPRGAETYALGLVWPMLRRWIGR